MKLKQLQEAKYSHKGQTFVDSFVLFDSFTQKFVYFSGGRAVLTHHPKKSGVFSSPEAAKRKLRTVKQKIDDEHAKWKRSLETRRTHGIGAERPFDDEGRDEEFYTTQAQKSAKERTQLEHVTVARYTIRGVE